MKTARVSPIYVLLISGLLVMTMISGYEYRMLNNTRNDSFGIHGSFALYKDGKLVFQSDQITYIGYATAICKIFNDSTACSQASTAWGQSGSGASVGVNCRSGYNHQLFNFYSDDTCVMTSVALTNSMPSTPAIGGNCPSIITANGMSPTQATTSFSQNTQQITLSVSWTATGAQNFDGACLVGTQTAGELSAVTAAYWTGGVNAFAMQSFSTQSVSAGQTWSAQWTFSF
jgi:hypothetical protein